MTKFATVVLAAMIALATGGEVCADDKEAELQKVKKELDDARKRIAELEAAAVQTDRLLEETRRSLLQSQIAEILGRTRADLYAKRFEELSTKLAELRTEIQAGQDDDRTWRILGLTITLPPPLPANLRGEVTDVAGDLFTISIGIDAGLRAGSVLAVYSADGKRKLGTAKVTAAFNLFPKQAVVKFVPARDVPLKDLKPEELPKKGDVVRSAHKARD